MENEKQKMLWETSYTDTSEELQIKRLRIDGSIIFYDKAPTKLSRVTVYDSRRYCAILNNYESLNIMWVTFVIYDTHFNEIQKVGLRKILSGDRGVYDKLGVFVTDSGSYEASHEITFVIAKKPTVDDNFGFMKIVTQEVATVIDEMIYGVLGKKDKKNGKSWF